MKAAQQICDLMIDGEMANDFLSNIYEYINAFGEKLSNAKDIAEAEKIQMVQSSLLKDIILLKETFKIAQQHGKLIGCIISTLSDVHYIDSLKISNEAYKELRNRKVIKNDLESFIPEIKTSRFILNGFSDVNDRLLDRDFRNEFVDYLLTGQTINESVKAFMDAVLQNNLRAALEHKKWFDVKKTLECADQAMTVMGYDPMMERAAFFDKFKRHGGMIGMRDTRTLTPNMPA